MPTRCPVLSFIAHGASYRRPEVAAGRAFACYRHATGFKA